MKIFREESLVDFKFWSGAKDSAEKLTDQELDQIELALEEAYPEGMDETDINDFFWHDFDEILAWIGKVECPDCGGIFNSYETCKCHASYCFRGIHFDDFVSKEDVSGDEVGWSQICQDCIDKYELDPRALSSLAGEAICGVEGCENEADYYVDFHEEECFDD